MGAFDQINTTTGTDRELLTGVPSLCILNNRMRC